MDGSLHAAGGEQAVLAILGVHFHIHKFIRTLPKLETQIPYSVLEPLSPLGQDDAGF